VIETRLDRMDQKLYSAALCVCVLYLRSGESAVLICSDMAARGLDVPNTALVVQVRAVHCCVLSGTYCHSHSVT